MIARNVISLWLDYETFIRTISRNINFKIPSMGIVITNWQNPLIKHRAQIDWHKDLPRSHSRSEKTERTELTILFDSNEHSEVAKS